MNLTKFLEPDYKLIWLVPEIQYKGNRFKNHKNQAILNEPLFVTELRKRNIQFVVGNIHKFNIIHNYMLLKGIIKQFDIDAIYTQFGFERFYGALVGTFLNKPVIWHERWHSLSTSFVFLKKIFYGNFIDRFVAVSEYIKDSLPKSKPVYVVHNGIDLSKIKPVTETQDAIKRKLGVQNFKYLVSMIAGFRPEKRHDLAIDIINRLPVEKREEIGFIFLGDGPLKQDCQKQILALGIEKNVIFAGHVKNIHEYLSISDILMLTTIKEGFGYCILEAWSSKIPVIAYNSSGPKEIVDNKKNGILIEPIENDLFAKRIIELLEGKQQRHLFGLNGHDKLNSTFTSEACQTKMKKVFDSALTTKNSVE